MAERERALRIAFAAGAVTDALALVPMLNPSMARLLWGFDGLTGPYWFAMGYAAALMLGWTLLLVWAYRSPMERRIVADLTIVVIAGLVCTEVMVVANGTIAAARMIPTWLLQAGLAWLFWRGAHGMQGVTS